MLPPRMSAAEVIERGTAAQKAELAERAIEQHSPESVGFLLAIQDYRLRVLWAAQDARLPVRPEKPRRPVYPPALNTVAKGFAPDGTDAEMGKWLYDNFAKEINISSDVSNALKNKHNAVEDFDDAYREIRQLVNLAFL